jgi:hypothetical protein
MHFHPDVVVDRQRLQKLRSLGYQYQPVLGRFIGQWDWPFPFQDNAGEWFVCVVGTWSVCGEAFDAGLGFGLLCGNGTLDTGMARSG